MQNTTLFVETALFNILHLILEFSIKSFISNIDEPIDRVRKFAFKDEKIHGKKTHYNYIKYL